MLNATVNFRFDASNLPPGIVPPNESVFEPVSDAYGLRLALVFGNHAPEGRCPFYPAGHCLHCDIGSGEGFEFDYSMNKLRLDWFRLRYADLLPTVEHLVVYNSGSVLNQKEMPREVLELILAFACDLDGVRVISLDSREQFIRPELISPLVRFVGSKRCLRPILGLETIDDHRRNTLLKKQMPESAVLRAFQAVGIVAGQAGRERVGLDVNIVVGGPGTDEDTAVLDAVRTARFAWETGMKHGIRVDLNLHAYYPSSRGKERFPAKKRCSLAAVVQSAKEITCLQRELDLEASVFIGWQDEGHDQQQDVRQLELKAARVGFDRFNLTQDEKWLANINTCPGIGAAG